MMAAILSLCGTEMITSCSSDDDDILQPADQPDDNGANSGDEEIGPSPGVSRSAWCSSASL